MTTMRATPYTRPTNVRPHRTRTTSTTNSTIEQKDNLQSETTSTSDISTAQRLNNAKPVPQSIEQANTTAHSTIPTSKTAATISVLEYIMHRTSQQALAKYNEEVVRPIIQVASATQKQLLCARTELAKVFIGIYVYICLCLINECYDIFD